MENSTLLVVDEDGFKVVRKRSWGKLTCFGWCILWMDSIPLSLPCGLHAACHGVSLVVPLAD